MTMMLPKHRPPTHPGEMLLKEFIEPLKLTQTDMARHLGISFPRLNELTNAKRGVTPDTALRIERLLGQSADFWLTLQLHWDLWHAMHSAEFQEIQKIKPLKLEPV